MLSRPSVNSRNILALGASAPRASKNLELTSGWKAHFLAYDGNSYSRHHHISVEV